MPIVKHKGTTFTLQWLPEWDIKLLIVSIKFRKGKIIDWKEAEECGYLDGLPSKLTRKNLSRRLSFLLNIKYDPIAREAKKEYNKLHPAKFLKNTVKNKKNVFKNDVPLELKKSFGYNSKKIWTEKQNRDLIKLVKKYPKGKISINWKELMLDPIIKTFPKDYNLNGLRSYYWSLITKKDPDVIKSRRNSALKYKSKNYARYVESHENKRLLVKNSVNSFLLSKLKRR